MKIRSPFGYLVTGIVFLVLNTLLWIIPTAGLGIVLGLPFLVLGIIFLLIWFNRKEENSRSKRRQWNFALQLSIVSYTLLYLIAIVGNFTGSKTGFSSNADNIDVFHFPGYLLIILLVIYIAGFVLSWNWKFYSGVLLLVWFTGVTIANILINITGRSTDIIFYNYCSFAIFLQGILYIVFHNRKFT